ncbi:NOL1/NOP2/sun family protein, putative [Roseobacter sp. CCS2]|nr:NOL1/NOP2/sun family protein, putative [Roseobacter sp. CCS2]
MTTDQLQQQPKFDAVFCDAPCSGSGTWRRTPDAKWRLTEDRLDQLIRSQATVLDAAAPLVAAGGVLIYATCSVLTHENQDAVDRFCTRSPEWGIRRNTQRLPDADGDGFFTCVLLKR